MTSPTKTSRLSHFERLEDRALFSADAAIALTNIEPPPSTVYTPNPATTADVGNDGSYFNQPVVPGSTNPQAEFIVQDPSSATDAAAPSAVNLKNDAGIGPTQLYQALDLVLRDWKRISDSPILAGDANLDGVFDTQDLVRMFQAGKYESGQPATWDEGDFDGDGFFDSSDLIAAFKTGTYETRMRVVVPPNVFLCQAQNEAALANVVNQEGARKANHCIFLKDGGWDNEYFDYDKDGKLIGSSRERFDADGMMRERRSTRTNEDGGRTTTTETFDQEGKWTGTTTESYDKGGKQTGGTKSAPDGKGGTTTQEYDPTTGTWK